PEDQEMDGPDGPEAVLSHIPGAISDRTGGQAVLFRLELRLWSWNQGPRSRLLGSADELIFNGAGPARPGSIRAERVGMGRSGAGSDRHGGGRWGCRRVAKVDHPHRHD